VARLIGNRKAFEAGWDAGCQLHRHLSADGSLFDALPLADQQVDGETCHAETEFQYARYYGLDVDVSVTRTVPAPRLFGLRSPLDVIRDARDEAAFRRAIVRAQREAQEMSAPRWQDDRVVTTLLTEQRILCLVDGEWLSFWHAGVTELRVTLPEWSLVLAFDSGDPLQLRGPDVPWYALAVAYLVKGAPVLGLPGFAPLANRDRPPPR
jgi:hypothetical protein